MTSARSLEEEGPYLNRNEVVELLSDAVQTLLKPENRRLLLGRLKQSKHRITEHQSKLLRQPSNVDQDLEEVGDSHMEGDTIDLGRRSPENISLVTTSATTSSNVDQWSSNCVQELEEVRHSQMEGDAIHSESVRWSVDQVSPTTTSDTLPITRQMTELEEIDQGPRSIENVRPSTEADDGKEGSSLTSIRRLKVLDVHSYVHKALRESALRSWLHSRRIEE